MQLLIIIYGKLNLFTLVASQVRLLHVIKLCIDVSHKNRSRNDLRFTMHKNAYE